MVVLLGGVWVVSIHAGNGHVDVGTWQEGDDDLEEEEELEGVPEYREAHPPALFPPGLDTSLADSEAYRHRMPTSPSTVHQSTFPASPGSETDHADYLSQSFSLSPMSPPGGSRAKSRRKHRYSILQASDATTMPAGGAFSIGLSPVSPGFAIVPKRRISGMRRAVQRVIMRRTVSESDMQVGDTRNEASTSQTRNTEAAEADEASEQRRRDKAKHVRAMARWQWLRGVFRDRDT